MENSRGQAVMIERDWEDSNKLGFVLMVQTMVLTVPSLHPKAAEILFDAMRCKKVDIPFDLRTAANEFIAWHIAGPKPAWLKTEWPLTGGIAGL